MNPGFEIVIDPPIAQGGKGILKAMASSAPRNCKFLVTGSYQGQNKWIMLYGAGAAFRQKYLKEHTDKGGRVFIWDLGYWDRDVAMRMSIDGLHPKPEHLEKAPGGWRHKVTLREDANPDGPIVLVGLGVKSANLLFDGKVGHWEENALRMIKDRFPGRKVLWRPKGKLRYEMPGTELRAGGPIEDVLKGASLVVCRHSNVAVDACIAGVPVLTETGAARALYSDQEIIRPSREQRLEFLRRLGWFNWSPTEASAAWHWVLNLTGEQ